MLAVVSMLACALTGCATQGLFGTNSTTTGAAPNSGFFGDQFNDFFRGQQPTRAAAADDSPPVSCPAIEIREGAGTYAVNAPGGDQSALSVRLQASFGQTARECHVNAGVLTIKVGVRGRVILGPAGTPGDLVVPLRYALVQEGVEPKTIWTRFYQVPTNVPPGVTNTQFTHVMEDMVVPLPKSAELDAYVIYIGFDAAGLVPEAKSKPKPKAKAHTSSANSQQSTH